MQKTRFKRSLSLIVCVVLTAAMALLAIGCNDNNTPPIETPSVETQAIVKGEGTTVFDFTVELPDGTKHAYEIRTDRQTVGEALTEVGLIAGEQGPYGLYVKTVDGVTLDYEKDGLYWSFYENGQYAMSGVDVTPITAGTAYAFKAEKA